MARSKLQKFDENAQNPQVVEPGKDFFSACSGNWHAEFFRNDHPIHLELACGYGEYTVGMAEFFPDQNFIGIDVKGDRIALGARIAKEKELENVGFLRCRLHEIEKFFAKNEISGIRVVFPDPRPRSRDLRRRITHGRYLNMYRDILRPEGWFSLKTDSDLFFEFTREQLQGFSLADFIQTEDLYESPLLNEHYGIQTRYERKWLAEGKTIKYLKCQFG
ncbi:MAG: tRNA (guanosine(46)-N7)-methyltransferase TrmB [Bacteroidota bacterium]